METVIRADAELGQAAQPARKPRVATVWLGGCSGCHMSLLDVDEWVLELASLVDIVYSPILDIKRFPEDVDITFVEGAVANEDNLEMIRTVRRNSRIVVAFGDCAVTGNVTALRNPLGSADKIIKAVYVGMVDVDPQRPCRAETLPVLLERVRPLHQVVTVDHYLHGCPPSAGRIREAIESLLSGSAVTELSPALFG